LQTVIEFEKMSNFLSYYQGYRLLTQKKVLTMFIITFFSYNASAQKFAYVDTEYILTQIPAYKSAQLQLNELSLEWQTEIDQKFAVIDQLRKQYEVEKVLLTKDMQSSREKEILDKSQAAQKLQQDKFGFEGELFTKKTELIRPIQDKLYDAINKVAKNNGLDFIFDKSGDMLMLVSNSKYDRSDEVLEELGVVSTDDTKSLNLPPRN
jgi:outer membrane protein